MAEKEHYFGLDLLRFFAASIVVLNHFGIFTWNQPSIAVTGRWLAFPGLVPASWCGWVGVEIFFVISGFVIAASARNATPGSFLRHRIIRVFPALWICTTLAFVMLLASGQSLSTLLPAYIRSLFLSPVGPYIDGVIWTLMVEAVFYSLIFLILLAGRFDRMNRVAIGLGVVSSIFLTVFACAEYVREVPGFAGIVAACGRFYFRLLLLQHGVFFACGMLVWYGFERGLAGPAVPPLLDRAAAAVLIWAAGLASLILSVAFRSKIYDRLKNRQKLLRDIGLLTYPVYLNHFVLGMTLVPALFAHGLTRPLVLALSLATVLVTSWLIMSIPERALRSALRSLRFSPSTVA